MSQFFKSTKTISLFAFHWLLKIVSSLYFNDIELFACIDLYCRPGYSNVDGIIADGVANFHQPIYFETAR